MGTSTKKSAFGMLVLAALTARTMSQVDLAVRLGMTNSAYLNMMITGRKTAGPYWVNAVAAALELAPDDRAALHRAAALDYGFEIEV